MNSGVKKSIVTHYLKIGKLPDCLAFQYSQCSNHSNRKIFSESSIREGLKVSFMHESIEVKGNKVEAPHQSLCSVKAFYNKQDHFIVKSAKRCKIHGLMIDKFELICKSFFQNLNSTSSDNHEKK